MRTRLLLFFIIVVGILSLSACAEESKRNGQKKKILVFTKTEGYRHESINAGVQAITGIAHDLGFETIHTESSAIFNPTQLSQVAVIVFLNTTGNILDEKQRTALTEYMIMGGSFMGIHSAADTETDWQWYIEHIGGQYAKHDRLRESFLHLVRDTLMINQGLSETYARADEWYSFINLNPENYVLIERQKCMEGDTSVSKMMPVAWVKKSENGRVFYTGIGHTSESYQEPFVVSHLTNGMKYLLHIRS